MERAEILSSLIGCGITSSSQSYGDSVVEAGTGNSEIFARISFSRIASIDIFGTLKFRDWA